MSSPPSPPPLFASHHARASLDRMGSESMELYQIHWPLGALNPGYWDGLADCVEKGLVKVSRREGGRGGQRGGEVFGKKRRVANGRRLVVLSLANKAL